MYRISSPMDFYNQATAPWLTAWRAEIQPLACAVACALAWSGALAPETAQAALGENAASIQTDLARLKAAPRASSAGIGAAAAATGYTTQEMTLPTGTQVREYINASGVIFAVSWHGPFKPDLATLLGGYFSGYANAPRSLGSTRTHMAIDQPNLVVRAASHARSFRGLAYVPQHLPQGIDPGTLQ